MTISAVATRYAEALADLVMASDSPIRPQDALSQLKGFSELARGSAELYNVLTSPAVVGSRKKAAAGRIAELFGAARVVRNFLFVLIDHHRIPALPEIVEAFERITDERLGFARAEVASAQQLNDQQRSMVNHILERLSGKRIRMRFEVDESLIGGVVARIGSTVYDGSVRGRLAALERRLSTEE